MKTRATFYEFLLNKQSRCNALQLGELMTRREICYQFSPDC
jgi:hypothetical protein